MTEHGRKVLYIQDVKTGRRLPSVTDSEEKFFGSILSSMISKDGKRLDGVYLCDKFKRTMKTLTWQIVNPIKFSQDASILVYGGKLYHLLHTNENIADEPIPRSPNPDHFTPNRPRFRLAASNCTESISSFDRQSYSIDIPPLDGVSTFGCDFHPSLPLALLTYSKPFRPRFWI